MGILLPIFNGGFFNFLSPIERARFEASVEKVKNSLGEERFGGLYAEGQKMTVDQAVALALEEDA